MKIHVTTEHETAPGRDRPHLTRYIFTTGGLRADLVVWENGTIAHRLNTRWEIDGEIHTRLQSAGMAYHRRRKESSHNAAMAVFLYELATFFLGLPARK